MQSAKELNPFPSSTTAKRFGGRAKKSFALAGAEHCVAQS